MTLRALPRFPMVRDVNKNLRKDYVNKPLVNS